MKKVIGSVLTVAMVAGMMTGCGSAGGSTDTKTSADNSASDDQVVIDVFQNKNEISDALQAAIDTYEEENPSVKINLETVGGSDYASSLKAKMLGNDPVEIFTLGGPDDIASYQDYLEPLTDQEWVSHVTAGGVDNVSVDDEVYGLPLAIEGYGLIYNKKIFEAAGIDASTLTTYDAIDKAFADLQDQIDEGKQIVVNDLGFIPAFDNYDDVTISDPLSAEVMRYVDAGKTIPWVFSGQPSGWDSKVAANIQNYLAGNMTWDEVIAQNIADWESMREQ